MLLCMRKVWEKEEKYFKLGYGGFRKFVEFFGNIKCIFGFDFVGIEVNDFYGK